ncbi:MAG: PQQ-like beta-propeller repeat protein, partial [Thermoanaerobaculia bacterium]|nr:PQQ-like beta-propeller repeat protein [Thermoanaerobaculia bacterium]
MSRMVPYLVLLVATAASAEWSSFRGPNGTGVSDSETLPVSWDIEKGENILWTLPLDGGGFSSPVQWGDHLYLTTVTPSTPTTGSLRWNLLAVNRQSGEVHWTRVAAEEPQRLEHHSTASHANPSPAVDGTRVVAIVGSSSLVAFDLEGKEQWRQDLGLLDQGLAGDVTSQWGTGSSPILWNDRVFVQVDRHRNSFVAAFDAITGKEIWRDQRNERPSWSTPAIYHHPKTGKAGLVTVSPEFTRGYDPASGRELWRF